MGYYPKAILGAALFLGAVVAFNVALLNLLETGTCASGNQPFVVANECSSDTGKWAGLLVGSIFGGLIGAGVFAFRGQRPGGSGDSLAGGLFGWGSFAWGLFFSGTGAVALIASLTGDLPAGGKTGGIIVGITFALMGIPVLLFSLKGIVTRARGAGGRSNPRPRGDADVIDKIARLEELRKSGALTQAEFEVEKAKLLAQG